MSVSAAIRRMLDAGLTIDQALIAAEAFEAEQEPVLTARQARNRRYYQNSKASEKHLKASETSELDAKKEIPPTPPKEKNNIISITREAEFSETFWPAYPRKVAKPGALKAFRKARDKASLSEIMAGLGRYQSQKPEYADWRHPATWLNDEGWADDYGPPPPKRTNPNAKPKTGSAAMLDALKEFSNEPNCKTDDFDGRTIEGTSSRASRQGRHSGDARTATDGVSHGSGW